MSDCTTHSLDPILPHARIKTQNVVSEVRLFSESNVLITSSISFVLRDRGGDGETGE